MQNCLNHPEMLATAYCRACGKPLCDDCKRTAYGTIYCEEHAPPVAAPPPPVAVSPPMTSGVSPGLAFFLGLIPGVGAIYNAQYAKGLIHALIFGLLVSIPSSGAADDFEPLFGMMITAWVFYMAMEAYHTARKRLAGQQVDEFSSLIDLRPRTSGFPVGAVALIAVGVLLLLNTLNILSFRYIVRYWPVLLIAIGIYMLYARVAAGREEVPGERQ